MNTPDKKPSLGLVMIMKDEEKNLPRSLAPLAGLFDEIVAVDTGSGDRSRELAESYGARVVHFDWVGDFSAARNFSIEVSTCDYLMWLDADNAISPEAAAELRALIQGGGDKIIWATEKVVPQGDRIIQKRVFPRRPDVRFAGRVHEQLTHPENFAQILSGVEVVHWGYAEAIGARKKGERNLELLLGAPETAAGDFYWLYQCGRTLVNLRRFEEAEKWLAKAGAAVDRNRPLHCHALILRSQALGRLGRHDEAEKVLRDLCEAEPDYGPGHYYCGRLLHDAGKFEAAAEHLELAIFFGPGDLAWGADPKALTFRAAFILGRIRAAEGRAQSARQALALARESDPKNPEAPFALAELALREGDRAGARGHLDLTLRLAPGHRRAMSMYRDLSPQSSGASGEAGHV